MECIIGVKEDLGVNSSIKNDYPFNKMKISCLNVCKNGGEALILINLAEKLDEWRQSQIKIEIPLTLQPIPKKVESVKSSCCLIFEYSNIYDLIILLMANVTECGQESMNLLN